MVKWGISKDDTVAIIAANTPEMIEAHYGVAMSGAVLNTINTRLNAETIAYILEHGEAKVLITDTEFTAMVKVALAQLDRSDINVIDIVDEQADPDKTRLGEQTYEVFIATGEADYTWSLPDDEWDAFSLNYTSGTNGCPKGVVYHHRGSYLMTLGTITD